MSQHEFVVSCKGDVGGGSLYWQFGVISSGHLEYVLGLPFHGLTEFSIHKCPARCQSYYNSFKTINIGLSPLNTVTINISFHFVRNQRGQGQTTSWIGGGEQLQTKQHWTHTVYMFSIYQ